MADEMLTTRRAQLAEERDRLREQLSQMGHGERGDLDFDEGFADTGQVTAERGEADALAATLQDTLGDIEEALDKVDAGSYGMCERCRLPIAPARLEAMPAARLCIDCARLTGD